MIRALGRFVRSRQADAVLLGADSVDQNWMDAVRDPRTGRWLEVAPTAEQLSSDAEFDRLYAAIYSDKELSLPARVVAVVDSGMLHEHPLIKGHIVDEVNLTDREDAEDEHGHGTLVALIVRGRGAHSTAGPSLLNVRVCGPQPHVAADTLIRGIDWVTDWAQAHPDVRVMLNLSIGILRQPLFGSGCKGKCKVCRAAVRCADAGVIVTAAAGNTRVTTCPASVAFHDERIAAVTGLFESAAQGTHAAAHVVQPAMLDLSRPVVPAEAANLGGERAAVFADFVHAEQRAHIGDRAGAERSYRQVLDADPFGLGVEAAYRISAYARARADDEEAGRLLEHVLAHGDGGQRALAGHDLGVIDFDRGNLQAAEERWLTVSTSGEPVAALAWLSLGTVYLGTGRLPQAIASLTKSAEVEHREQPRAQYLLGCCLAETGDFEGARHWLTAAVGSDDQTTAAAAAEVLGRLPRSW